MSVRKAVIPAAGLGTRFLPASKAVPKNLIPVVDRPMMQYAVEELSRAGIDNICIVISHGTEGVADHFAADEKLEAILERTGKAELLQKVRELKDLAEIYYVYQHKPLGLGHAVGVAREHVGDEPFVVLLPDELFDPTQDLVGELIATYSEENKSAIAVIEVPRDDVSAYGVIDPVDESSKPIAVKGLVEKPPVAEAPSNLMVAGRYVLTPEVFEILSKVEPGAGGEIQLTDALNVLAGRGELVASRYEGRRWDVGRVEGWLNAVVELGLEHPDYGEGLARFIESLDI